MKNGAAVRLTETGRSKDGGVRLNLLIPAETRERLETLKDATGATSLTEAVSNALRLHEWLVRQQQQNREVLVRDRDGTVTVVEFLF